MNVVGLTRLASAGTLAEAAAGPEGRGHWALGEAAAMRAGDSSADSDDDAHTGDSRGGPRPGDGIEGRQDGSGGAPSRESRGADEAGGGEAPAAGVRTSRASLRRRNFHIAVGSERVASAFNRARVFVEKKRKDRKQTKAVLKLVDPEQAAKNKVVRNLKRKVSRKRQKDKGVFKKKRHKYNAK